MSRIIVLCILIFVFLDRNVENKIFLTWMIANIPRLQSALIFLMKKKRFFGVVRKYLIIDTLSRDLFLYLCYDLVLHYFRRHECVVFSARASVAVFLLRGGADKSLARPGRKKATATKLGIYSTYSPWSSIQFFARCSNFRKPLKKIQNVIRPTRSPR